jgi:hypothetical protein
MGISRSAMQRNRKNKYRNDHIDHSCGGGSICNNDQRTIPKKTDGQTQGDSKAEYSA